MPKRLTLEEFINKAVKVHGNLYDYEESEYVNCKTHIDIWCNNCNKYFSQKPDSHLQGQGCPKCAQVKRIEARTKNTAYFIQKARLRHGDFYDYSKSEYIKAIEKLIIICPKHGEFLQTPNDHTNGYGCPNCVPEKITKKKTSSKNLFIYKAKKIHGDLYDYSLVDYIKSNKKVKIICNQHGEYEVTPNSHLSKKQGCHKCGIIIDPFAKGYVYIIRNKLNNLVYIGITTQSINHRFSEHKKTTTFKKYPLGRAILELGINNFYIEKIEETIAYYLKSREEYWINYYNSKQPNGYNSKRNNYGFGIVLSYIPKLEELEKRGYLND